MSSFVRITRRLQGLPRDLNALSPTCPSATFFDGVPNGRLIKETPCPDETADLPESGAFGQYSEPRLLLANGLNE